MKFIKGKTYKIVDNITKQVVACGPLRNLKYKISCDRAMKVVDCDVPYITFDEIWFFNTDSDKYIVEESDEKLSYFLNIPDNYSVHELEAKSWTKIDVYKEHNIDELDPEVKDLVFALNDAGFKTVSSCCGHDLTNLFVDILFENFAQLEKFVMLIENRCGYEFLVTTWYSHKNNDHSCIQLRLMSVDIGEQAYSAAKHLTEILRMLS